MRKGHRFVARFRSRAMAFFRAALQDVKHLSIGQEPIASRATYQAVLTYPRGATERDPTPRRVWHNPRTRGRGVTCVDSKVCGSSSSLPPSTDRGQSSEDACGSCATASVNAGPLCVYEPLSMSRERTPWEHDVSDEACGTQGLVWLCPRA